MKLSARDVAKCILREHGRMAMAKLQALVYLAQLAAMREIGAPLFDEPMYAERNGPVARSISPAWMRHFWVNEARSLRRCRSLRRRVRRWYIAETRRGGGRIRGLNMPGGWSVRDAIWQNEGITDALRTMAGTR